MERASACSAGEAVMRRNWRGWGAMAGRERVGNRPMAVSPASAASRRPSCRNRPPKTNAHAGDAPDQPPVLPGALGAAPLAGPVLGGHRSGALQI